jgi:diguanylate cyclase (GGDEF)-like protein/PAS domain S-box-containing protein
MYDVLLVEDDATYARLVEIALSAEVRLTIARTMAEAQEAMPSLSPDVVLADLHLPDAQGRGVIEALVAARPVTAVVGLSGIDGPATDAALAAGATSFVLKGDEMDGRMLTAIADAAQRTHVLREAEGQDEGRPVGEASSAGRDRPDRPAIRAGPVAAGAAAVRRWRDARSAEQQEDEARTLWRTIAGCAPIGLFRADASGQCTWMNERYLQLTGLTVEQARGEGWLQALHPGDRRHALELWRRATAAQDEFSFAVRYVRPDGSIVRVMVAARALSGSRRAGGWVGVLEDETLRFETERELTRSRAQLESILGASASAVSLKTPNDRFILANPACEALYGRPVAEIVGASSAELLGDDYGALVRELDHEVLETGDARQDELHFPHPDGTLHCWLSVRFPVRDADGVLIGVGVVSTDVTESRRLEREHAHQRTLLEEAQRIARLASWEWQESTDSVWVTTDFGNVLDLAGSDGWQKAEDFLHLVHPEDLERVRAQFLLSQRVMGDYDTTFRARSASGEPRTMRARWRSERRDSQLTIFGTMQDVTLERAREQALLEAEEELRLTFDHAPIGLALADLQLRWTRVNAAVCSLFGRRPGQLLGRSIDEVIAPEDRGLDGEQLQRLLAGELEAYEVEKRCLGSDGALIRVVFSVMLVGGSGSRPRHLIVQLLDVTARRDLEQRLQELAETDPLTGLANRRRLDAELHMVSARLRRFGEAATVLIIDLDGFKEVNDEHGHEVGDAVLRVVAQTIRHRLRQTDLVARLGGDEFAVLLTDATEEVAGRVAQEILDSVRAAGESGELPKALARPLSASIGIARLGTGEAASSAALRQADGALYAAKREGAGSVRVAAAADAAV